MRWRFLTAWCSRFAMSLLFTAAAGAQEEDAGADDEPGGRDAERPALRAGALSATASDGAFRSDGDGFRFDGRLEEPAWGAADSIANFITVEPKEGGVPAGRTTVRVLTTAQDVLIGVRCYEKDPAGIVSYSKARDADLEEEDHVLIVLDPFRDGRSGYVFAVNPSGARFDGLVSERGEEVNSNWDAVWDAKVWRDGSGWSAEIWIPVSSISYKKGLTSWGLNVERRVQRLQETSRWSAANRDYEVYQTSHAGLLTNVPAFDLGLGLSVRPALVGRADRASPASRRDYTGDLSLDVTKRVGSNLLASGTVNTDFGETEVDVRQTNLTRFDLFFPEKRTFFLEGSDIFEFGLGLDPEILVPFFTRRIGLVGPEEDLVPVPLTAGAKLNGRAGSTNVGALAVRAGSVDSLGVPGAAMGAVRVKQNVLAESSVGLLGTFGDPLGRADSWLAGADLTYQTSHFRGDKNLLAGVWGLRTDRAGLEGDKYAYGGMIDFPNDVLDLEATYIRLGDGFQPSLGFAPRTGKFTNVSGQYTLRPEGSFVREMQHQLAYFLVTNLDNEWESYAWTIKPFDWLLESGDRLEVQVLPQGERLGEPFEITDGVFIPAGAHRWTRYSVGGALAPKRRVSGEAFLTFGGFYEGSLNTVEAALAVKPWPVIALELNGEWNDVKLPEGHFTEAVYGGRVEYRPSADFQVSSLLQYDNEDKSFGTNTRARWTFRRFGELFVVYNHNLRRSFTTDRFRFDSNQLLVKLQYAVRM